MRKLLAKYYPDEALFSLSTLFSFAYRLKNYKFNVFYLEYDSFFAMWYVLKNLSSCFKLLRSYSNLLNNLTVFINFLTSYNYHLLNIYCVPGTSLSPLHVFLFHLDSTPAIINPIVQIKKLNKELNDLPKISVTKWWSLGLAESLLSYIECINIAFLGVECLLLPHPQSKSYCFTFNSFVYFNTLYGQFYFIFPQNNFYFPPK